MDLYEIRKHEAVIKDLLQDTSIVESVDDRSVFEKRLKILQQQKEELIEREKNSEFSKKITMLYLCHDYGYSCKWEGSLEPVDICPVCGKHTFTTECIETPCAIFYRFGDSHKSHLRIRNTRNSCLYGQEIQVESGDIDDLISFATQGFFWRE